jgi:hypothetical protein
MAIRTPKTVWGRIAAFGVIAAIVASIAGLAGCGAAVDQFDQAFNGIKATMTTYNQTGQSVDEIKGASFRVSRDTEFDTKNDEGKSNNDSKVLLISLGDHHIGHVGSTLILAEDGLNDITAQIPPEFRFANSKPGTPWLNDLWYNLGRYWKGTAQTIMVRSQDGTPIKVYAGNDIQVLSTEVPSSTWFRIDGKTLFVYRADITRVDNALLPPPKK